MERITQIRGAVLVAAMLALPAMVLASDATFDKTLNVSGHVQLEVSTGAGYVHVTPGSDNQVHVIGHVHANHGWMGSSDDAVKKVVDNPPIQQSGSTIRIGQMHDSWFSHVSIDYDITTPKDTRLKAESGSGDLKAVSISGGSRLETGSGSIHGEDLGGESYVETGSGDIRVDFSGSGNITANAGSGSIHTDQAISMQGSLEKHHITGNVNGGGPTVKVETGSGSIRIH